MSQAEQVTVGVLSKDIAFLEELRPDFAGHRAVMNVSAIKLYESGDLPAGLHHLVVAIARAVASNGTKPVDLVYELVKQKLGQDADCRHRKVMIYVANHTPLHLAECRTGKPCNKRSRPRFE